MCQACSQQILDTGLFFRFAVLTATNLQRHGLRKEEIKHYTVGKVGAKGMSNKKPLSEAQKKANANTFPNLLKCGFDLSQITTRK